MNDSLKYRDSTISLSRVLGMTFIVLCHVIKYYSFVPGHDSLGMFFNCGVELFLFISGYLYGQKIVSDFNDWYFKRVIKIALPSIIVSVVIIIASIIVGEHISASTVIAYLFDVEGLLFLNQQFFSKFFFSIGSLGPLWFTTVIMLCYLLVPILQRISTCIHHFDRAIITTIFVGIIISIIISKYIVISYFVVFMIGYFTGKIKWLDEIDNRIMMIFTLLFLFTLAGRLITHKFFDGTYYYEQFVLISHPIIGIWFVVVLSYLKKKKILIIEVLNKNKVIEVIDSYSFYVYLVHGIFCMGIFNVYEKINSVVGATFSFVICTILSSGLLKVCVDKIQKILINNSILNFKKHAE
jgi:peptidoglycan/LPS O-acetylase OafA/YrhL